MKKYLFVYLISFVCIQTCFGQTIQASIGAGSSPNKVIIYLKTNVTQTPAVFSTLQFNLAIPNTISPVPSVSAVSLAFTGVNWIVATPYDEDGMWNYNIYTAAAGYSLPVTTNTEFQALEISFQGGPGGVPTDVVRLTCLPDGGIVSGSGYFFCSGTLDSDGNNLFYDRDGAGPEVVVTNGNSYNSGGFPVGDFTSVARFTTGIVLPVSFSSFNVQCTDKGALITWSTESESNSEKFEVQQSINGTDWKIIGTIKAAGNSTQTKNYTYLDSQRSGDLLYRIKQVDVNGNFKLTSIKLKNCQNWVSEGALLYPIPATDKLNIVIQSDWEINTELKVVEMGGKLLKTIPVKFQKGSNYLSIPVLNLPSGHYLLVGSNPDFPIRNKFIVAH